MKKFQMQTIGMLILVLVANEALGQLDYPNEIRDPCVGRESGFARDLTSCRHYFWCANGVGSRGVCNNNQFFNGEIERCVTQDQRKCFECRATEAYHLNSVPNACHQYIQCFNSKPTLHLCPQGLVYDGRTGIQQCNVPPPTGGCYRENDGPGGSDPPVNCPAVTSRPVYIRHPNSCSVYFVCTGSSRPDRGECPNGLHFNLRLGVCDRPQNAGCQPGQTTTTQRPPNQPGPVFRCQRVGEFIPDRTRCRVYHICTSIPNGYSEQQCDGRLIFDHITRKCTSQDQGQCWATSQHGSA